MNARKAVQTKSTEYIDRRGYTIKLHLLVFNDGSNKIERWVYGPDGYYRPALSFDVENVDQNDIDRIFS